MRKQDSFKEMQKIRSVVGRMGFDGNKENMDENIYQNYFQNYI